MVSKERRLYWTIWRVTCSKGIPNSISNYIYFCTFHPSQSFKMQLLPHSSHLGLTGDTFEPSSNLTVTSGMSRNKIPWKYLWTPVRLGLQLSEFIPRHHHVRFLQTPRQSACRSLRYVTPATLSPVMSSQSIHLTTEWTIGSLYIPWLMQFFQIIPREQQHQQQLPHCACPELQFYLLLAKVQNSVECCICWKAIKIGKGLGKPPRIALNLG